MSVATENPPITVPETSQSSGSFRFQQRYAPYLFVSPFVLIFFAFGFYPIVKSIILSLYITNGPKDQVYAGLSNYRFLLRDNDFRVAVLNTATFAFWSVFLQLPLSLGLALLLSARWVKGREWLRLIFFSPHLVGSVFVAVLFRVIYLPQFGLMNRGIHSVAPKIPLDLKWLGDPLYVMPAIVITSLWMYVGFNMIYFLAALQAVDTELYEAAEVDGAGAWSKFWAVTLPGIKPVAVFVLVTATIGSFQLFELPWVLLDQSAGPNKTGLTIVMHLYRQGFITGDLGYAAAIGWMLALGILFISLLQMRVTGTWKAATE